MTLPASNGAGIRSLPCLPTGNAPSYRVAVLTCFTSGRCESSLARFGAPIVMSISDGFVLAKKTLYDDEVR